MALFGGAFLGMLFLARLVHRFVKQRAAHNVATWLFINCYVRRVNSAENDLLWYLNLGKYISYLQTFGDLSEFTVKNVHTLFEPI